MLASILVLAAEASTTAAELLDQAAGDAEAVKNPILPTINEMFWAAIFFIALWTLMKFVLLPRITKVMDGRTDKIRDDLAAAEAAEIERVAKLAPRLSPSSRPHGPKAMPNVARRSPPPRPKLPLPVPKQQPKSPMRKFVLAANSLAPSLTLLWVLPKPLSKSRSTVLPRAALSRTTSTPPARTERAEL